MYREASCIVAGIVHCNASQAAEFLKLVFLNHGPVELAVSKEHNGLCPFPAVVAGLAGAWLQACVAGCPFWKGKLRLGLGKKFCAVSLQESH